ncbi:response regulator transcription factor [Miltoncostaea oceani]|jgi:DNA-binding response OmpR family regulator|uniref:response regulator transcription factor n=1 Tax=Miltoncostaea oceani TaxID=2843216 RepID=UPI001C3E5DDB|nr:response regulator transcription factor [Miltoncostaea oceani]
MAARVLVVDDQAPVRRVVRRLLERSGYEVDEAGDGGVALDRLRVDVPDAIVLDVSMPVVDGWTTLERIRELSDVPVLMLTGRSAELERARGLRGGADDYLIKPFGGRELVARLDVLVRRGDLSATSAGYSDDWLEVDRTGRRVRVDGTPVELSSVEARLLGELVRRAGRLVSVPDLACAGWGHDSAVSTGQVVIGIAWLRASLGPAPHGGSPIETLRGFGYRYVPPAGP